MFVGGGFDLESCYSLIKEPDFSSARPPSTVEMLKCLRQESRSQTSAL